MWGPLCQSSLHLNQDDVTVTTSNTFQYFSFCSVFEIRVETGRVGGTLLVSGESLKDCVSDSLLQVPFNTKEPNVTCFFSRFMNFRNVYTYTWNFRKSLTVILKIFTLNV